MSVIIGPIGQGGSGGTPLTQNLCQVSITHPSPAYTVSLTGTGDSDLDPAIYAANFVTVLNGFEQQLIKGGAFEVQADGRVKVLVAGHVNISAYADVEHSTNNSTAGTLFSIERAGSTILSSRSLHARLPNAGDIGNLAGSGLLLAQVGDVIGVAVASDTTGVMSIRASSIVFEMFT